MTMPPVQLISTARKRIVVLGGSGYVGQHVIDALAARPEVVPITLSRRTGVRIEGAEVITGDVTDAHFLREATQDAEVIVNLISGSGEDISRSAAALLEAVRANSCEGNKPLLIHFSSMAVYGEAQGVVDERVELTEGLDAYARGKIEAEATLRVWPRTVIFRPGCIVGPGSPQWSIRLIMLLKQHRLGDLGEFGDGWSNIVDVQDVVQALMAVIKQRDRIQAPVVYNLAMPDTPTWNDYFIGLGVASGATPVRRISPRVLKLEAKILGLPLKILEKAMVRLKLKRFQHWYAITPSLLSLWQRRLKLDVMALDALGLSWTPLDEVLRRSATVPEKKDC